MYPTQLEVAPVESTETRILPVIDVRRLVKTYPGNVRAVDGVTFSVQRGKIFALLGPNGAGKSTTIRILTTLSRADSGSATVAGLDVGAKPNLVRRRIGSVAQRSGVDRNCTGRENLTLQGQLHRIRGANLKRRVSDLLEQFGLREAADRVTSTYSGGMQRKLDLAIGLIQQPEVLFLDEPTTGLDPQARMELWAEFRRLSQSGITILLTTHNMEEADSIADTIAIVDHGRIVIEGTPDTLKAALNGDSVQIEATNEISEVRISSALSHIEGVREVTCSGNYIHAFVVRAASVAPALLLALESEGIRVASIKISRPSLNDVFLQHTGKLLQEVECSPKQIGAMM